MIVKVTNAVKNGEIVLPTIGYAVKAGVELTISDEDYYCNDIQIAIRKGFLVVSDAQGHGDSPFAKKIAVTNLTGRPLALDQISLLIGETSYISEREYNSTNVRTAINAGMIEIARPEEDEEEEEYEQEAEYEEPEEEYEEPVVRKPQRGKSVKAADVVALLEHANRKPVSKKSEPAPKPKVTKAPLKAEANAPKRKVTKLLIKPTGPVTKTASNTSKPSVRQPVKLPARVAPSKPVANKKPQRQPQRPLIEEDENEDQLTRLQRIASKVDVGGSVNRSSRHRDEDPVERLTRLAQEIEQGQIDEQDAEFVDQGPAEDEGEYEDAEEMQQRIDEARSQATGTRMSAWNPHTKAMMGRREASNKVAKLIGSNVHVHKPKSRTMNEDGAMVGDVDFSDEGVRSAKKVVSAPMRKGAAKKPGLQPVGRRRGEPGSDDGDMDFIDGHDHDEIVFVDREQNRERLRSRPDILRRIRNNNVEID